jgi:hypothetical protein
MISRKTDPPPFADVDRDFESPVVIAVLGVLAAMAIVLLLL